MRRGADRVGGGGSVPTFSPSRAALLCETSVAACVLATALFASTVGITLTLVTSAPAGAVSSCAAGCHDLAGRLPVEGTGPTTGRGDDACDGRDRLPFVSSDGHRPVVKTVTVTEPDGSAQHYSTMQRHKYGADFLVTQGATVAVIITWDSSTFKGDNVDRVRDCVYSTSSPGWSPYGLGRESGTPPDASLERAPNNGMFDTSYTITQRPGTTVCDRGQVSGEPAGDTLFPILPITEQSAQLCFTVEMPAVTPEVPSVLLLPASAVLVGLGAFWLDRRRRAKVSRD